MTVFGLTSSGFVPKTYQDEVDEAVAAWRAAFGTSIPTDPATVNGNLIGIYADRLASLWSAAQAIAAAMDPDEATGSALDAICALTGTVREGPLNSTVTATAVGTAGTLLSAGRQASVVGTGVKFTTLADATLAAPGNWAALTGYTVGQRRKNSGKIYQCITAGTSAGAGGPTTTAADITDGTVHWEYLGTGTGVVDVDMESASTGPLVALAGTLTTIETAVGGWASVTNLLDAVLGRDNETDAALRIRREAELRAAGKSTVGAIQSNILKVHGVTACTVFENTGDVADADSVPAHGVEILVQGGANQDIWDAVLANVAAGIRKDYGNTPGTADDSEDIDHAVAFSRPVARTIWVIINVTKDPAVYPSTGDALVKSAITDWGDLFPLGKDVTASAVSAQAFNVPGVLDVTAVLIGLTNPPTLSATITCSTRQLAAFDTSRISVVSVDGTP